MENKKYRPANGSEGEAFKCIFCYKCKHEIGCEIELASIIYDIDDINYPEQWKYNNENNPICTKFCID